MKANDFDETVLFHCISAAVLFLDMSLRREWPERNVKRAIPDRHFRVWNISIWSQERKKRPKIRAKPEWNPRADREKEKLERLTPIFTQRPNSRTNVPRMTTVKASETTDGGLFSGSLKMWFISGLGSYMDDWAKETVTITKSDKVIR